MPPTPPPLDYRPPHADKPSEIGHLGEAQKVFDTIGGPNLRLRDNLIQLAAIAAAIPLAFLITLLITRDLATSLVIGILGGLIGGVLISGAALGIYRGLKGIQKKTSRSN